MRKKEIIEKIEDAINGRMYVFMEGDAAELRKACADGYINAFDEKVKERLGISERLRIYEEAVEADKKLIDAIVEYLGVVYVKEKSVCKKKQEVLNERH